MRHFIKENTWLTGISTGWGNGYVILPKNHKWNGKDYDELNEIINVHYGLTFAEKADNLINDTHWPEITEDDKSGWVIGFDTAHMGDDLDKWPKSEVEKETLRLKKQCE